MVSSVFRKTLSGLLVWVLLAELVSTAFFSDQTLARTSRSSPVMGISSGSLVSAEKSSARLNVSPIDPVGATVSQRMKSFGKKVTSDLAGAKVRWNRSSDKPLSIAGMKKASSDPVADTRGILEELRPLYGISSGEKIELTKMRDRSDKKTGQRHTRMSQTYEGLPVIGGEMIAHTNKQGQLYAIDSNYYGDIRLDTRPKISAKQARDKKLSSLSGKKKLKVSQEPRLVVYPIDGNYRLAWEMKISHINGQQSPEVIVAYIDAKTGKEIDSYNTIKHIESPTATGVTVTLTGVLLDREGGSVVSFSGWLETQNSMYYLLNPVLKYTVHNASTNTGAYTDANDYAYRASADWGSTDKTEVSAAKNAQTTLEYYSTLFGFGVSNLSGVTNLPIHVHYGNNYANAYWDGSSLTFGDGDGTNFDSLATLDIMAHEFGHAWTENTSDLVYKNEAGALNESFSDISGVNVEFYAQEDDRASYPATHTGKADWLMGEDATVASLALRDMRNPANTAVVGTGGEQPTRYHGTYWYYGSGDNGGVHYNSSVQNLFYYLLAEGGSGTNDGIAYSFSGVGINAARQIAYEVNTHHIVSTETYQTVRQKWIDAANVLDVTGVWAAAAAKAWDAVGVFEAPEVPLTVTEDFEAWSGSTLPDGWSRSGTGTWSVDTSTGVYGSQSIKSPTINNWEYSMIEWSGSTVANGFVSFFARTSSEAGYDKLQFYVDGDKYGEWSGETPWTFVYYYVPAGQHTLSWAYVKDITDSAGSDAVWIDGVNLPSAPVGYVNVSPSDKILVSSGQESRIYTTLSGQSIAIETDIPVTYAIYGSGLSSTYTGSFASAGSGSIDVILSEGDGRKDIHTELTDRFGNVTALTSSGLIYLDTTGPAMGVINSPIDGHAYATGSIDVDHALATDDGIGTSSGAYAYVLSLSGVTASSGTTHGESFSFSGLVDGAYVMSVVPTDSLGNSGAAATVSFTVDTTVPTLSGALQSGIKTNTGIVSLSIASSELSEYTISGQGIAGTYTGTVSDTGVLVSGITLTPSDGEKDFSVMFTDPAGNASATYTGSFLLDATAPNTPTNLTINGGVYIGTGTQSSVMLTGSGDASESGATVNYVISEWDGTGSVSGTGIIDSSGTFTILGINVSTLMDGLIGVWVSITDLFGNTSGESSISIAKSTVAISGGISFLSGSSTVTTDVSLRVSSNKSIDYVISGDDLASSVTGSIVGSGANIESLSLTGTDGIKTVTAVLTDSVGATGSVSASVLLDRTAPVVSVSSHASGAMVTAPSVTLTGSVSDLSSIASLTIAGSGVVISSGTWAHTVSLSGGNNSIMLNATDALGNSGTIAWDIRRIATVSAVNAEVRSLTGARVTLVSNLVGTGTVVYGTSSGVLNAGAIGSSAGTTHSIDLDGLASDTLYYYRTYVTVDGYDGEYSTVKTFRTPKVVDISSVGSQSLTGTVSFSGASATGVVFSSGNTGSLAMRSIDGANSISFPLTGLAIVSSGSWDGIIAAPEQRELTGSVSVGTGFAAVGPVYKIGSDTSSLVFSGQSVSVSLSVGDSYNGKTLSIYRSDNAGSTFATIGTCTVSSGICSFSTNHFSLFAFGEPTDTTPDAFSITSRTGAELGIESTSAAFTLSGYNAPTTISITGGTYSIDSGSFTSASGTLAVGSSVRVKLNSSSSYSTMTTLTLTVGGVSSTYSVTTKSQPVSSGGGGGGGGSSPVRDNCPNGDYSASYYDGSCGTKPASATGVTATGSIASTGATTTITKTIATEKATEPFSFSSPLITAGKLSAEAKKYVNDTIVTSIEKKLDAKISANVTLRKRYYTELEKYFYAQQLKTKYTKEKEVYKYLRSEFRKKKFTTK